MIGRKLLCASVLTFALPIAWAGQPAQVLTVVQTGENAPESIVRVLSTKEIALGKHQVNVAGGPCQSESSARFVFVILTNETIKKGDLFFMVSDNELRRAGSKEMAQYAKCNWR